jgi:hypothetical protein
MYRKFYISKQLNKEIEIKKYMTQKKTLIYTFHYWEAFCRGGGFCLGAYVRGAFVLDPKETILPQQILI